MVVSKWARYSPSLLVSRKLRSCPSGHVIRVVQVDVLVIREMDDGGASHVLGMRGVEGVCPILGRSLGHDSRVTLVEIGRGVGGGLAHIR